MARRGRVTLPRGEIRDAGVHARRHLRHREVDVAGGARVPRREHHPRQHVPPDAAAGHEDHRRARRAASLHALGEADPHGFRRFPGVQPRRDAAHRRAGRALPVAHRRQPRAPDARELDGRAALAALGHRHGVRRLHRVARDRSAGARVDGALDALGRAVQDALLRAAGRRRRATARQPLRHRAGRDVSAPAPRIARGAAGAGFSGLRHRRPRGRRAGGGAADRARRGGAARAGAASRAI